MDKFFEKTLSSEIVFKGRIFDIKHDVWLAHYTDKTDYKGDYKMWQLRNNGKVDGIYGYVDIDILYE